MLFDHQFLLLILLSGLAKLCQAMGPDPGREQRIHRAPLHGMEALNIDRDHYIVVFKQAYAIEAHWRHVGLDLSQSPSSKFAHQHHFDSYTAKMVRVLLILLVVLT